MKSNDHRSDHESFDDDLRARFTALRREEAAHAPEFALPAPRRAARSRRWSPLRIVLVAACALVMAAAVIRLSVGPAAPVRNSGDSAVSLLAWKAPTDFLLETPGRELLHDVPEIGVWPDSALTPAPDRKHPPARKKVLP